MLYDVICISETWLNTNITDSLLLNNSKYVISRRDRSNGSRGGGVCMFIKSSISCINVALSCSYSQLEVVCVDLIGNNYKHRFIAAYRPPNYSYLQSRDLVECLSNLVDVSYPVSICGDFNYASVDWSRDIDVSSLPANVHDFASMVVTNGLTQLVTQPTHGAHTLDLLLVTDPLSNFNVSVNPPFSTSDHNSLSWHTWFPTSALPCPPRLDFKKANYTQLADLFYGIDWMQTFTKVAPNDVEGIWQLFKSIVTQAIALYVPEYSARTSARSYPSYIRRAIRRKRTLWRNRHCHGNSALYAAQARKCKKLIRRHQAYKERHLLSSNSLSAFYRHVNAKLNSSRGVAPLRLKDKVITDDTDKAAALNSYFASSFTAPTHITTSLAGTAVNLNDRPIVFSEVVTYKALHNAKHTCSAGPDSIPSIFWAKLASSLALPISILFNASYSFGLLPADWKTALVLPLFKKNDPSLVSNYRPISLTSTLCKVMESIIKVNLTDFCFTHNIFSEAQHGFMRGRSTCSQLLEAKYDWCVGLDNNAVYDVVTIDFRKAFDVIPHDRLISKLADVGICGQTVRWVAAFLSNRQQRVNVNGAYSTSSSVSSGVIQGSVLGPVLFTLYINDLPVHCPNCTVKLFADDVKAYKCISTPNDRLTLQSSLDLICQWAEVNKLGLSVEKCCYLQVGYSNLVLTYRLNSEIISPTDSIIDLGICIHSNLKSGPHCSAIVSRASTRSRLILKTFLSRDVKLLTRAFTVYVRPLLEYCTPVWSPHLKKDIDLVESVQRTFTRKLFFICHLPPTSYDNRLQILGLQRLELRRIHFDLVYMFKLSHNITFSSLSNTLCFANNSTRGHKYKLYIQRCNKSVLSTYFLNRVAPIWNVLPESVFYIDTLPAFKSKLSSIDFTCFLLGNE